ncbi:MAG: hypothetical protein L0229_23565 [Blastocatellia bacterium]|nr:hypothetical protein [Blastocatellia bacterium]
MKKIIFAFALIALTGAFGFTSTIGAYEEREIPISQSQETEAVIPLEGLDPVMLTQGKEVIGKTNIYVIRDRYKYLFSSEENKAAFEKDPARYEIQLGGSCARMGPQVNSNPDLFAVHEGRIYVFGSGQCQQLFTASPEKYLEPARPEITASPEAIEKGRALIEKAVASMGGAAKIDGLTSYQETGLAIAVSQQGETEFKYAVTKVFPDRVRYEYTRQFGTVADVLAPGGSFVSFQNDTQKSVRLMRDMERADLEKQLKQNGLDVLRARKRPDFKVAATGTGKAGETTVEHVVVAFGGIYLRMGIDAATGRILSLAYTGRQAGSGEVGEIVQMFSDFRTVEGLTLPFKTNGTFKGTADPQQSYRVESIAINSKVDPSVFEKP